jgi:hypothetical protein
VFILDVLGFVLNGIGVSLLDTVGCLSAIFLGAGITIAARLILPNLSAGPSSSAIPNLARVTTEEDSDRALTVGYGQLTYHSLSATHRLTMSKGSGAFARTESFEEYATNITKIRRIILPV